MKQLFPFSDPPKECNYLVLPSYWLQALSEGSLFAWLWDIETKDLVRKEQSKSKKQEWDWELLVRALAENDIYENEEVIWAMENVPLGLRNRKRIWRLVQDIFSEQVSTKDLGPDPWSYG